MSSRTKNSVSRYLKVAEACERDDAHGQHCEHGRDNQRVAQPVQDRVAGGCLDQRHVVVKHPLRGQEVERVGGEFGHRLERSRHGVDHRKQPDDCQHDEHHIDGDQRRGDLFGFVFRNCRACDIDCGCSGHLQSSLFMKISWIAAMAIRMMPSSNAIAEAMPAAAGPAGNARFLISISSTWVW